MFFNKHVIMSVGKICSQNAFQLMGMGVTVGVFMFMYMAFIEPIEEELDFHDAQPAHREATLILEEVLKQSYRAELRAEENSEQINDISEDILILNEKMSYIQQKLP